MASRIPDQRRLEDALFKHGMLPENARLMEVVMGVGALTVMRYEIVLTVDDIRRFGLACIESADDFEATATGKPDGGDP